jgi:hypothetical protein
MSRATRRSIRRAGIGLTLLVAGAALSGCSGPAPMAFRITDAGVLEIASRNALDGVTSIEIDLQQYVVPWAYDHESQADAEFAFTPAADIPEGSYLLLGGRRGVQLTGELELGGEWWNRISVSIVSEEFVIDDQVNRNQLVTDEWIWNRDQIAGAVRPCAEPATAVRVN